MFCGFGGREDGTDRAVRAVRPPREELPGSFGGCVSFSTQELAGIEEEESFTPLEKDED